MIKFDALLYFAWMDQTIVLACLTNKTNFFTYGVFFLNQTLTQVDTLQLDLSLNILVVVKEACHAEVEHV